VRHLFYFNKVVSIQAVQNYAMKRSKIMCESVKQRVVY
jgi:hypothetical protein